MTASDIYDAMKLQYQTPEWLLSFEVGNSTGTQCRRRADAVAVNTYPSKGFEIRGFEVKVSKSDLASELKTGLKSDEIARFCDYWFLVVPKGLVDDFTLPKTWGVIELDGVGGKLRQKTRAEKLEPQGITRGFMCALIRGYERAIIDKANARDKAVAERIKNEMLYKIGSDSKALLELREKLNKVADATGIRLDSWEPTQKIINRLKATQQLDVLPSSIQCIEHSSKRLLEYAQEVQTAVDAISKINDGGIE